MYRRSAPRISVHAVDRLVRPRIYHLRPRSASQRLAEGSRLPSLTGQPGDDTSLNSIDWPATEAYAIGLNGLYLNRQGREAHGIVTSGEQIRALIANLREQLLAWRDPANGRQIVESVYEEKPAPQNAAVAPDLIVSVSQLGQFAASSFS